MKKAAYILTMFVFTLTMEVKGDMYPFIQNPGFLLSNKLSFSIEYIYNFAPWWYIMDNPGNDNPSYDKESLLHYSRASFSYRRFSIDFSVAKKEEKHYHWTDEGNCLAYETSSPPLFFSTTMRVCVFRNEYTNFGLSVFNFSIIGFMFTKNFEDFSYSIILESSPTALLKPTWPYSIVISAAYSPITRIWFFNELKIHEYFSSARSGYMNMIGLAYKYRILDVSLFYNFIYDGDNYSSELLCPATQRYDHRIGCQIRVQI